MILKAHGGGRKTYNILKPYCGNAVSVIHIVKMNLGSDWVATYTKIKYQKNCKWLICLNFFENFEASIWPEKKKIGVS